MTLARKLVLTTLCVGLLPIAAPVDVSAQRQPMEPGRTDARPMEGEFDNELDRLQAEWAQRQQEMDRHLAEWEREQDHRRDEEGDAFDQAAFEFERGIMARRRNLEERRHRLNVETFQRHQELNAEFAALEEAAQKFFSERQQSDMASHEQEWEAEQQRRRDQEGENFDEDAYQFEKGIMARRRALEERRMKMDEELRQAHKELDARGVPGHVVAGERDALKRREREGRQQLDAEFRALEQEQQDFFAQRERSHINDEEQRWEDEQQRRRDEEGEHFDEEGYEFEKQMMTRRRELSERRIRSEEEIQQAYRDLDARGLPGHVTGDERDALRRRQKEQREALDAEMRALEEEGRKYWMQKQRAEMERFEQEWEAEQQRLRDELGEDFDEDAYEAEKRLLARRRQLEERRVQLDEKIHQAWRELEARELPQQAFQQERQALERRARTEREALEADMKALEEEARAFMEKHGRHDMDGDHDGDDRARDRNE